VAKLKLFLAVALVGIVQLYIEDFNVVYGFIAVLIGAFVVDSNTHVLV
jgi:hypothetical protein